MAQHGGGFRFGTWETQRNFLNFWLAGCQGLAQETPGRGPGKREVGEAVAPAGFEGRRFFQFSHDVFHGEISFERKDI